MKPRDILDAIVQTLRDIDVHLSGDDSALQDPWEEVKEQLQNGLTHYWPAYVETIRSSIAAAVSSLSTSQFADIAASLKCTDGPGVERVLLQRLLSRGKREKVKYKPFDFTFFCYPLLDFTVYGRVIERTGVYTLRVKAFSVAAPFGEEGVISTNTIEEILSAEQFEQARAAGWPEVWRAHG
ncbi:hypothetical protein AAG565_06865 [Fontimonas sp. SYSU GA230001]|uniref:hypothetical protein n=1 Tax=Fontimonas sp. SYSU GA230001 TaxID=3142450 RepID=UPI0032B4BA47